MNDLSEIRWNALCGARTHGLTSFRKRHRKPAANTVNGGDQSGSKTISAAGRFDAPLDGAGQKVSISYPATPLGPPTRWKHISTCVKWKWFLTGGDLERGSRKPPPSLST
jgi:hypothetical protein